MNKKAFLRIIKKFQRGTASPEEERLVEAYYDLLEANEGIEEEDLNAELGEDVFNEIWDKIREREVWGEKSGKRAIYGKIAAALVFLLATGVAFFALNDSSKEVIELGEGVSQVRNTPMIISPAGQKAVLITADGEEIALGDNAGKRVTDEALEDHEGLIYEEKGQRRKEMKYNTLSTPRGGEFKLVLSDGTKVWLNAESSLKYPVAFMGAERKVILNSGEAYFEVAPNEDQPFKVELKEGEVQVLGTEFNVRSYPEMKGSQTTLASGKVKVKNGDHYQTLNPGSQAIMKEGTTSIGIEKVDLEKMLAWKSKQFYFDRTSLEDIMNEVARWYDIEVSYKDESKKAIAFNGIMSRYENIEDVLERFSLTESVKFEIEGKKVIVK